MTHSVEQALQTADVDKHKLFYHLFTVRSSSSALTRCLCFLVHKLGIVDPSVKAHWDYVNFKGLSGGEHLIKEAYCDYASFVCMYRCLCTGACHVFM